METEIVFCERCGVSIPEQEVVRARQASGGRDLCPNCVSPGKADGDLQLYFCENCRISIAVSDVLTGAAKPDGSGYLCGVCARSTPAERVARKTAVDREMADLADPAAGPAARGPSAPIYFCDACNASIPASLVATGRALVQSGRTYCELCRPRLEAARSHARPGVGAAAILAAAFLASAATAAGLVAIERWNKVEAGKAESRATEGSLGALRREIRATRESGDTSRELVERNDRSLREFDRKLDSVRGESLVARAAMEKAVGQAAAADKVARLERQFSELEDSVDALREEVAKAARKPPAPPEKSEPPTKSEPPPAAEDPPVKERSGGAMDAPTALSSEAMKCIGLLKDKEAAVRFSAAIELGKLGERGAWPALAASLRGDDDPFVRRACARSIGELKAYGAFPDLVDSLLDGEEYVAIQASRVIKEMAGQDFGFKQNSAKGERKKVADRAKKWWEENKDRLAPGSREGE